MKKKTGNKSLYVVWLILLAATALFGGFGGHMMINYLFLLVMGVMLFWSDKRGLAKISQMTEDLSKVSAAIPKLDSQVAAKIGREALNGTYRAKLDMLADSPEFRQPAVNEDWHRLLKDWGMNNGMDCEIEDYLCEEEIQECCNYSVCSQMPGILTALGILGTFLGLVIGLQNFDFSNADQMTLSVEALVGGLNVAFYTSIYGVTLSIVYNLLFRRCNTAMSMELNRLYDAFHGFFKPVTQQAVTARLCGYQEEQNALLKDMNALMDERFGERLGSQMAQTMMPVFERINQSLDHVIMDFHKEQAASLEKIVDAFVQQMSQSLNIHVEELGKSVDQLSVTQNDMSKELKQLIEQIKQTGADTAQINQQAGDILRELSGYVPQLEQTAKDSARIIEQMGKWSESIRTMADEQSRMLGTLADHEGNLDEVCEKINSNQELLNTRLVDFTEAAKVLAERERDPLQFNDLKEMLTAYMTSMQQLQKANAEHMEATMKTLTETNRSQQEALIGKTLKQQERQNEERLRQHREDNELLLEQMKNMVKTQEDMVYVNGRIYGKLFGKSTQDPLTLPSGGNSSEEKWMEEQSRRMEEWMQYQQQTMDRLILLEEQRNRSVFQRIRSFFIKGQN